MTYRISELERRYVAEVLDGQFRSSASTLMTHRLEELFCQKFGRKFAISHVNGTATLHSALVAAGVGFGDEVIVPPLTMSSTAFAVLHAGAMPVFADVDAATFNLDPADVRQRVSPRTKAIMPVALYGLSMDMDGLTQIARERRLRIIEDDAQCFLGYYKGRIVGSLGDLASFSFQSSKHMTSGEGGMVVTDDEQLAEAVRKFNSLGYAAVGAWPGKGKITRDSIQDPGYARHSQIGWNYRMPELCAAVALAQLERLEELVAARVRVAELFSQVVDGCPWLVPQAVPEGYVHSYWTYVLKLENGGAFSWHEFRSKFCELGGDGIYAAWRLSYLEPAFAGLQPPPGGIVWQRFEPGLCPVAEDLQPRLLQFKTNYLDWSRAERQAEVLSQTIRYFESERNALTSSRKLNGSASSDYAASKVRGQ